MSSCTECHGMAGEKYDDHDSFHCPRLQDASQPTNSPTTNQPDLSACCKAPVELSGGIGDFSDSDRAVTMHYVCTACKEPCDLYVSEQSDPLDEILEDLIIHTANEYGGFEGFDEEGDRDGFDKAKAALRTYIAGEVAKAEQIPLTRAERFDYEQYKRQHTQALEDYHEYGKAPIDSPERIAAYVSQLSLHNLRAGAEVLRQWRERAAPPTLPPANETEGIIKGL